MSPLNAAMNLNGILGISALLKGAKWRWFMDFSSYSNLSVEPVGKRNQLTA